MHVRVHAYVFHNEHQCWPQSKTVDSVFLGPKNEAKREEIAEKIITTHPFATSRVRLSMAIGVFIKTAGGFQHL
jgi:hypothetical protein